MLLGLVITIVAATWLRNTTFGEVSGTILIFLVWGIAASLVMLIWLLFRVFGVEGDRSTQRGLIAFIAIGIALGYGVPLYFHTVPFWTALLNFTGLFLAANSFGLFVFFAAREWADITRGVLSLTMALETQYLLVQFQIDASLAVTLQVAVVLFATWALVRFGHALLGKPGAGGTGVKRIFSSLGSLFSLAQVAWGLLRLVGTHFDVLSILPTWLK
jgi:hypothetical protein